MKWNLDTFFKGTALKRSCICIMSEIYTLTKILYKKAGLGHFAAFVPGVQTTSASLCKQKYSFPALTSQFTSPTNYSETGSSGSLFPSQFIYHHQYYRPSHSVNCTCSARPDLKHKLTDFWKSKSKLYSIKYQTVKALCVIVSDLLIYLIWWQLICYCRAGIYFKRLFNTVYKNNEF